MYNILKPKFIKIYAYIFIHICYLRVLSIYPIVCQIVQIAAEYVGYVRPRLA